MIALEMRILIDLMLTAGVFWGICGAIDAALDIRDRWIKRD